MVCSLLLLWCNTWWGACLLEDSDLANVDARANARAAAQSCACVQKQAVQRTEEANPRRHIPDTAGWHGSGAASAPAAMLVIRFPYRFGVTCTVHQQIFQSVTLPTCLDAFQREVQHPMRFSFRCCRAAHHDVELLGPSRQLHTGVVHNHGAEFDCRKLLRDLLAFLF